MRITLSKNFGNDFYSTEFECDVDNEREVQMGKFFFDKFFEEKVFSELKKVEQVDTTAQK